MKMNEFQRWSFNRNHKQMLKNHLSSKNIQHIHQTVEISYQSKLILVPTGELNEQLKLYLWRQKTQLPIVKVHKVEVKSQNSKHCLISLTTQAYPIRLIEVRDLPLFKILYILKETLIGFQRLLNRFGPFLVTSKMIALDQMNRCKVWLNEEFSKNAFRSCKMDEKYFLQSVFHIFQGRVKSSKNNQHFFRQLYSCNNFISALTFIENYAQENKITLSTFCRITQQQKCITSTPEINCSAFPSQSDYPSLHTQTSTKEHRELLKVPQVISAQMFRMSFNPSYNLSIITDRRKQPEADQANEDRKRIQQNKKSDSDITAPQTQNKLTYDRHDQHPWVRDIENVLFANELRQPQNLVAKSFLCQQTPKVKQTASRKFSQQHHQIQLFENHTKVISKVKSQQNDERKVLKKWQTNQFQSDSCSYNSFINMFNQNKWKVKMQGLFEEDGWSELKKSRHEGRQIRKVSSQGKFQLLEGMGKEIKESYISNEDGHSD